MNAIWNESFKLSFELSDQNLVRKERMIKQKIGSQTAEKKNYKNRKGIEPGKMRLVKMNRIFETRKM